MPGNEVTIQIKVEGVAEAKRQIDELTRAGLKASLAGGAAGGLLGRLGPVGTVQRLPWQAQLGILGGLASPAAVPVLGAGLGLGAFGAVAAGSGVLPKLMKSFTEQFKDISKSLTPMIIQALKPVEQLGTDLLKFLRPLAIAGGQILDAFVKPLDALVRSPVFSQFIAEMAKVGVQFAKLFGPELAKMLSAILKLFTDLAPAGMKLWHALGPLVTTLVDQLAGLLGKLLPPLAKAFAGLLSAITPLIPPLARLLTPLLVPLAKLLADLAPLIFKLASMITGQLIKALIPLAKAFADQSKALLPLIPPLVRLIDVILPPFIRLTGTGLTAALTAVANVMNKVVTPAVAWFVNKAVPWLRQATQDIAGFFSHLGPELGRLGRQAITDLWDGIKTIWGNLTSWVSSHVKALLGIFSPVLGIIHGIQGLTGSSSSGGATGPGIGAQANNMALARAMFPWPSNQWPAFNNVEMAEAGYSMTARNPTSGAYGMAQFIGGPSEYYQYGGNPNTAAGQLTGMFNYIRQRYGNPVNAWNFHLAHGWYDKGGFLPPGLSLALNTTGKPEPVGPAHMAGGCGCRHEIVLHAVPGELMRMIRAEVIDRGGGDVQTAFGWSS